MVNAASVVHIVGIERKRSSGNFKSSLKNVARNDASRGMTESSREYIAQKTKEQLSSIAPTANTDISAIRDNVLHLSNIIAKNTGDRITAVTNFVDSLEAEEDRLGKLGHGLGGAGLDIFGILQLYATKSGGATWFSTSWDANPRTVASGNTDPNDTRFWFGTDNPTNTPLNITGDGSGLAYVDQANDALWFGVNDAWLNTEMTMNIYIDESDTTMNQLDFFTRDDTGNCRFRGYIVKFKDSDKVVETGIKPLAFLELITDTSPLASGLPRNQWLGLKVVIRTISAGLTTPDVVVESYVNYNVNNQTLSAWSLVAIFQFSQALTIPISWVDNEGVTACAGSGDGTADKIIAGNTEIFAKLTVGNVNWWLIHNPSNIWMRHLSVREIDPLP